MSSASVVDRAMLDWRLLCQYNGNAHSVLEISIQSPEVLFTLWMHPAKSVSVYTSSLISFWWDTEPFRMTSSEVLKYATQRCNWRSSNLLHVVTRLASLVTIKARSGLVSLLSHSRRIKILDASLPSSPVCERSSSLADAPGMCGVGTLLNLDLSKPVHSQ